MTQTPSTSDDAGTPPKKKSGGLSGMLLADLRAMAGALGVSGAGSMKKAQLVEAIKGAQSGGQSGGQSGAASGAALARREPAASTDREPARRPDPEPRAEKQPEQPEKQPDEAAQPVDRQPEKQPDKQPEKQPDRQAEKQPEKQPDKPADKQNRPDGGQHDQTADDDGEPRSGRARRRRGRDRNRAVTGNQGGGQNGGQGGGQNGGQGGGQASQGGNHGNQGGGSGSRNEPDTTVLDDDVLVPAAGILDVLDNYAFVRTSGYLPGADDVYLSLSMVRKFGLRRGDAIVGQVRQPREGERKEKFNPMVRIDAVNGAEAETARTRPEFTALTPVHPSQRLRLETGNGEATGRVVDLVAPVGKGQRGLIVSPPKAGKTSLLHAIAGAVTANNPECHLMVVLIDERPEEVTDFQRSIKGEVIASTFDRPPADHTIVAELAIERAKRLVELGHDVVILLDGLTRLGRAYNLTTPSSGRTLPAGVDVAALYPVKRFFGAARAAEHGGSLTILATAQVGVGSEMDEVFVDDLEGTGNTELRLSGELAAHGLFPAVDVASSGTRHEQHLLGSEELEAARTLRQGGATASDPRAGMEQLLERIEGTRTNLELLGQVRRTPARRA